MISVRSYRCPSVSSFLAASSKTIADCSKDDPFCFFGFGIGEMNSARLRPSTILCVGWPVSSSSQCFFGYSYGELSMGRSKNRSDKTTYSYWTELILTPILVEIREPNLS